MTINPFSMAAKAGLSKKNSLKEYLVKVEDKTTEQADQIIQQIKDMQPS